MSTVCKTADINSAKIDRNGRVLEFLDFLPDPCAPATLVPTWVSITATDLQFETENEEIEGRCTADPCQSIPKEIIPTYNVTATLLATKGAMMMNMLYGSGGALEISNLGADITTTETFTIACKEPCSRFVAGVEELSYYVELANVDYNNLLNNNLLVPRNIVINNITQGTVIGCADYNYGLGDFYPRITFKNNSVAADDIVEVTYTYADADACFNIGGRYIAHKVKFRLVEYTAGKTLSDTNTCMITTFDCGTIVPSGITYRDSCSTDEFQGIEVTLSSKSGRVCLNSRNS